MNRLPTERRMRGFIEPGESEIERLMRYIRRRVGSVEDAEESLAT